MRTFANPRAVAAPQWFPDRAPLAFHRRLAGYRPTPLIVAPQIAAALDVAQVLVKDESSRLGLPAFKIIGASWAAYRALDAHVGGFAAWQTTDDLRAQLAPYCPLTLAAATDGNHGRAVARMARLFGLDAHIFVPADMVEPRRAAIADEGATVTIVDGTYDDTVNCAAATANDRCLVIADTAWDGYEDVPRAVIEGYSTILWEIDDALAATDAPPPDLVAVQIGVGAFAAAVTRHYRRPGFASVPRMIGVEPDTAACVLASVAAGALVAVPGPHPSIMAGLNCGLPSPVALPILAAGVDIFVAIEDEWTRRAMRLLAADGITAGETGAAGLAGLLALHDSGAGIAAGLTPAARVLVFNCEGATDPAAYARIIGGAA